MKRLLLLWLVVALVLAVAGPALAKDDNPSHPAIVTGGCTTDLPPELNASRSFAFNAMGGFEEAKGMVLYKRIGDVAWLDGWQKAQFEVRHLIVIDNLAIMAGFMIKSDNDTIPHWMYFLVEDNGEGSATAPDRMRPYMPVDRYAAPTEAELMEVLTAGLVGAIDVTNGNIQVR